MCGTLSIASNGSGGRFKKKKKGTVRATGPEVTKHKDSYQKQEVKQYLIELGQISKRPKRLGFSASVVLNRSTVPANRAYCVLLSALVQLIPSASE